MGRQQNVDFLARNYHTLYSTLTEIWWQVASGKRGSANRSALTEVQKEIADAIS